MRGIDHIVYCTTDLDKEVKELEQKLGISITYGGKHLNRGTHNAVFKIGHSTYFEILAADPQNKEVPPPRWMGIDSIQKARITRWAIVPENIEQSASILEQYKEGYGSIQSGSRALDGGGELIWQLTDPLPKPQIEVVPFLLNWEGSIHPTKNMPDACSLEQIRIVHPDPYLIATTFESLKIEIPILKGENERIEISLKTPNGLITLS